MGALRTFRLINSEFIRHIIAVALCSHVLYVRYTQPLYVQGTAVVSLRPVPVLTTVQLSTELRADRYLITEYAELLTRYNTLQLYCTLLTAIRVMFSLIY